MKKIYFLMIIFSLSIVSQSQENWYWLNPLPQGDDLSSVDIVSDSTYYFCGEGGVILKTVDGGSNFIIQKSGTSVNLNSISFVNSLTGWVVGSGGIILKTTNGGTNWVVLPCGVSSNLASVVSISDSMCYAAGEYGVILKTTNGGLNWLNLSFSQDRFISLFFDSRGGRTGWAGTILGKIFKTTNGGENWILQFDNVSYPPYSIYFQPDNTTGYICGGSNILKTTNGGLNWSANLQGHYLTSIMFSDYNTGFCFGRGGNSIGIILKTTNAGTTWEGISTETYGLQHSDVFNGKILVSGQGGTMLYSSDVGNNWVDLRKGILKYFAILNNVQFIDEKTGWIVGEYSGTGTPIFKTVNGGLNWFKISDNLYTPTSFYFLDRNTGWATTSNSQYLMKTVNGGSNWNLIYWYPNHFTKIFFANSNTGWASGDSKLFKSTDGGQSWITQVGQYVSNFTFINQYTGWVYGSGKIQKTTNGGMNWIEYPMPGISSNSIEFVNELTGWATKYFEGEILKTTDGGISWAHQTTAPFYPYDIYFTNINTGTIVGSHGIVVNTTNGGTNWITNWTGTNNTLHSVYSINNKIWVVGENTSILKKTFFSSDVGLTSIIDPINDSTYYGGCYSISSVSPFVTVKNFGISNQVKFYVHCEIKRENNVVYTRTKMDTLDSGETDTLGFDNFFGMTDDLDHSEYILKAWTTLTSDSNSANDTVISKFNFGNHSYGFSEACNYYFINNTTDAFFCTFQNSVFNWEDTTGSINLISNGTANYPFAAGNISNGCFRLLDVFQSGNKFKYFDTCYDTIVVSTNGIIGLGSSLDNMTSSNPVQIPSVTAPKPAIFPFWQAFNFQDPDIQGRNLKYKLSGNKLIITYDRVPAYNTANDSGDYVSFQIILETGTDCNSENGKIKVQFDSTKSGSTFLNNYYNVNLNSNLVGIQNADGTLGIQYRYSNSAHQLYTPGYLFGQIAVDFGQINELLPVELESFISSVNENNVFLNWRVTSETNNSGFDIERSNIIDQTSNAWTKIGNVAGNGNSNSPVSYTFEDKNLTSGKYKYRLKQIDFNGSFEYYDLQNEVIIGIPGKYNLSQNFPNPFNPLTKIKFEIPVDSKVILKIYDNTGREMKTLVNEFKYAGYYSVDLNGSNLSSGVYFYKLTAGEFTETKRMILLK